MQVSTISRLARVEESRKSWVYSLVWILKVYLYWCPNKFNSFWLHREAFDNIGRKERHREGDRYWDQEEVFAVYLLDGVTKINCFATMCWMVCGLFVLVSGGPFQGSLQKYKIRKFRVLQGVRCRTKGEKERERKEWERRKKELVRREKDWNRKRKRDRHDSLFMITGRERERKKERKREMKESEREERKRDTEEREG